MMFKGNKVGYRIVGGYCVVLVFMLLIGVFSILAMDRVAGTLEDLTEKLGVQRKLAHDIEKEILIARYRGHEYIRNQKQKDMDAFFDAIEMVDGLITKAEKTIKDRLRRMMLMEIKHAIGNYKKTFQEITSILIERNKIYSTELDLEEINIDSKLAGIRINAEALKNVDVFLSFGNAQNSYQLMRLYASKYLDGGDERYWVLFKKNYNTSKEAFANMAENLNAPKLITYAREAVTALDGYAKGFEVIHNGFVKLSRFLLPTLDSLEQDIGNNAKSISASIEKASLIANQNSKKLVSTTRLVLIISFTAALLASFGLGIFLSRRITKPLHQVMEVSRQIADQDLKDLSREIAALSRGDVRLEMKVSSNELGIRLKDEIGEMARAFDQIIRRLKEVEISFAQMAAYLNEMADAARNISNGDLNIEVHPKFENDALGNAFSGMIHHLRTAKEKVEEQIGRMEYLRKIDTMISTNQDLEETLSFILEVLRKELLVDAACIMVLHADGETAFMHVQKGFPKEVSHCPNYLTEDTCAKRIILEKNPCIINDLNEINSFFGCLSHTKDHGFYSYYGLPLKSRDTVKGVMQLFFRSPFSLESGFLNYLKIMVGQATIAISSAQLIRNLEDHVAARTKELEDKTQELRRSEQKLSLHIHRTPLAVVEWDPEFKVNLWNPAANAIFGYSMTETFGRPLSELVFSPKNREKVERSWKGLLERQGGIHTIQENITKTGQTIICEWHNTALVEPSGKMIGIASFIQDITDRKKADESLRQNNQKILDSIRYAKLIQSQLLPQDEVMKAHLPDSFVIWRPRDIIGGDIYFLDAFPEGVVLAVVDCTGHGVPGAIMTMIASTAMKRAVRDEGLRNPAHILNRMNYLVKTLLKQDSRYALSNDGMDAAVCMIHENKKEISFAGAKLPLFVVTQNEGKIIQANRMSLGYKDSELDFTFTNHSLEVKERTGFYITTDGFTDQLGGKKEIAFGKKRMLSNLAENIEKNFQEQENLLRGEFNEYKGQNEIMDDITVIGFGLSP